jgi:hypothetical protein
LAGNRRNPEGWTTATAHTFGEFKGQARWIGAGPVPTEPNEVEGLGEATEDGEDNELAKILSAITEDVQRVAAAASASVMAEFAGRMQHARKCLPRWQVPGALQSLKEARDAALAIVKRNAAADLAGRREAAVSMYGKRIRSARSGHPRMRGNPPDGLDQK